MADAKKTLVLKVRVDPMQKADLAWAASKSGLDLSGWIRSVALREADAMKKRAASARSRAMR